MSGSAGDSAEPPSLSGAGKACRGRGGGESPGAPSPFIFAMPKRLLSFVREVLRTCHGAAMCEEGWDRREGASQPATYAQGSPLSATTDLKDPGAAKRGEP